MGKRVLALGGEDVGMVRGVLTDGTSDRSAWAVVSFGNVFGLGGKLFPVPIQALRLSEEGALLLPVARERLPEAPELAPASEPPALTQKDAFIVRRFYGVAD